MERNFRSDLEAVCKDSLGFMLRMHMLKHRYMLWDRTVTMKDMTFSIILPNMISKHRGS